MSSGGSWDHLTDFLTKTLEILRDYARRCETITYEGLSEEMMARHDRSYPHYRWGSMLGRLSHWERDHGRPHISAIVVNRDGTVGPGFWTMTVDEMGIKVFEKDDYLANMQHTVFSYWRVH